jgi:hypothetical protein
MKDTIFLIFNKDGITGTRKTVPPLRAGEYATRVDVTVDDKYFKRIIPNRVFDLENELKLIKSKNKGGKDEKHRSRHSRSSTKH